MQTLKLKNFGDRNIVDQTQLSSAINSGVSSLPVQNSKDFQTGFALIGAPGSKNAEIVDTTSPSSAIAVPLSAPTSLSHNQVEPVYALYGDQIRVYRAANVDGSQPADVAFSPLTIVPIDSNGALTIYTDASGGGGYWYKSTYRNSVTASETDIAASPAVRGNFTVYYCSLDDIRQEAGFQNASYVADDQIDDARQAAQDTINGQLDEFYETPFQAPIPSSLKRICKVLAAGYLRQTQYSQVSNPQVNGENKIKWAEAELKKLSLKERVLVNKEGDALDSPGATGGIEGWPNSTTETAPGTQGGGARMFRISDVQGKGNNANGKGNLYYGRRW